MHVVGSGSINVMDSIQVPERLEPPKNVCGGNVVVVNTKVYRE